MAHTLSLLDVSVLRADILVTEAGTPAAPVSHDLAVDPPGSIIPDGALDLSIGPAVAFADAAAAQAHLDQNMDVNAYLRSATPAATPLLTITAGVSAPATPGNFRLILNVQKSDGPVTALIAMSVKIRHTITDS